MPSENSTSPGVGPKASRDLFVSHYAEIYQFAIKHNMTIERWPHNSGVWILCFTPPQGGSAGITIRPVDDNKFVLEMGWQIDDYDAATLSSRHGESPEYRLGKDSLTDALREALAEVLAWRKGEWSQVLKRPQGAQQFTREQFQNMQARWPKVRLPGDAGT